MRFKRTLTATTALMAAGFLATAAPTPAEANMEVTIDGMSRFLLQYAEDDRLSGVSDPSYNFEFEARPNLRVRAETDTGIVYGGRVEFQAATWDTRTTRRAMIFIDGAFGRIELGNDDGAADTMILGAHNAAAGTGGIDGLMVRLGGGVKIIDSERAAKITYYTPRVAGFQLGASFTPNTDAYATRRPADTTPGIFRNHWELGANYVGEFGGVNLGLAGTGSFGQAARGSGDRNLRAWSVGGTAGFMGATFGALYGQERPGTTDERDRFFTVGGRYGIGPARVGLSYLHRKPRGGDRVQAIVGSADYALFPGMVLQGDLAYSDQRNGPDFWSGVAAVRLNF
jgi:outer membrane protein OmpU